jgi:hypothetical protein
MVSAPPARSDDNPLEEAFTIGVCLDPGIVGKREMDFASCGRSQRTKRYRRAPAKSLVCRRLSPLLELERAPFFEAITVEVDWAVVRKSSVQNSIAEILQGIEASSAGSGQKSKVRTLEFALQRLFAIGEMGGNFEIASPERLGQKKSEDRDRIDLRLYLDLTSCARNHFIVEFLEP